MLKASKFYKHPQIIAAGALPPGTGKCRAIACIIALQHVTTMQACVSQAALLPIITHAGLLALKISLLFFNS